MTKQERRRKAAPSPEAVADTVDAGIEAAVAVVKTKRGALSDEHAAMGDRVKELRDGGMAWWQIGYELGLPGSADTVAKGKGGAAFARKIYKAAHGEVPRTQKRDGSRSKKRERNEHVRELKETTRTERQEAVRRGESVIKPEMTDQEIIDMLEGRTITWSFNLANVDGQGDDFFDTTTGVYREPEPEPKKGVRQERRPSVRVEGLGNDRVVHFHEFDPLAPLNVRAIRAGMRTVRLSAIHTVK